jgi:hypothetical protein
VIAMAVYCQLEGLMLDAGVVITPPGCREKEWSIAPRYCQSATRGWTFLLLLTPRWLLEEGLGVRTYKLLKSGTNVELDTSLPLLGCSNWKNDYRLVICGIFDMGIAVHRHRHRHRNQSSDGLPALVTAVIAPGLVPLVHISIGVSPTATGAGVLIIAAAAAAALGPATGVLIIAAAAAAAMGPATGVLIIAATAAFGISRRLAGAAARSGSVCHCVR